ncbi:MAG: hypothetical protein BBJ57_02040 [Desulfobacterales bacterium PC51MH44]|nr:MAG: hypothetical protein BBJ57_02040 [Desulfobacterales bacterium PC51MH44]
MAVEDQDKIKKVLIDGESTEMQTLKDRMEWEKYQDQKDAVASSPLGNVTFLKGRPSGTI